MDPELAIQAEELVEARVRKLAAGVRDSREEMTKVQMELNLQMVELQLKVQPSTPLEVKEQRAVEITTIIAVVNSAVTYYTKLFEQSFEVLTTLQEDPNIQCLETEACKLQQRDDEVKGTMQTISLTQKLMRMQQAKALKEQVDAAQHKEAFLKVCLEYWIDEAYTITTSIEENLTRLQETRERIQGSSLATSVTKQCIEEVQEVAAQCTAELAMIQSELGGLRAKISTLIE